ncbi:hypothetical protein ONS95_003721 [Cadophora gregata]|uniref:uncharacterized protein n=1 Tax=Cadophora gregata TaxID=51156 RepID=UPI0026DC1986|nr:uncharacterized protein ONS95_003721 [Cadophora gregata]KAK0107006.1 hypothetical protein ONS95_003721 [Cadophora gregata]
MLSILFWELVCTWRWFLSSFIVLLGVENESGRIKWKGCDSGGTPRQDAIPSATVLARSTSRSDQKEEQIQFKNVPGSFSRICIGIMESEEARGQIVNYSVSCLNLAGQSLTRARR